MTTRSILHVKKIVNLQAEINNFPVQDNFLESNQQSHQTE